MVPTVSFLELLPEIRLSQIRVSSALEVLAVRQAPFRLLHAVSDIFPVMAIALAWCAKPVTIVVRTRRRMWI